MPRGAGDWILHVDLDQFLAAVEVLRRPELAGRPVVVGGDGDPTRSRQVVATASYEARAFGVRSGMPLRTAARRCPDAVFLPTDRAAYDAASAEVMATLRSFPVVVEVWGWDEAFVGATTDDPEALAHEIKGRVLERTRLAAPSASARRSCRPRPPPGSPSPAASPASPGRRGCRRWATGRSPPSGASASARPAGWPRPGVRTVHDLAWADHDDLARRFGPRIGPSLRVLGLGGDRSPVVDEPWVPRSRSKETTYPRDLTDPDEVRVEVARLAREVTASVVAEGRIVTHVHVKVRTATFFTRIKSSKLPEPTTDPDVVAERALVVLDRFEPARRIRLLGVRVMLEPPG